MPDINLAQETVRNRMMRRRRRVVYIVSIVIFVIVLGVWGTVEVIKGRVQKNIDEVQRDITRLDADLRAKENIVRDIMRFRGQLESLQVLLGMNAYWSGALRELERVVIREAVFSSLEANVVDGSFSVSVEVPSIDHAADLIVSIERAIDGGASVFSHVSASEVSGGEMTITSDDGQTGQLERGNYSLSLTFVASPKAFSGLNITSSPVDVGAGAVEGASISLTPEL